MFVFIVFVVLVLVLVLVLIAGKWDVVDMSPYDLKKDGVCTIKNVFTADEIEYLKSLCEKGAYKEFKDYVSNSYKFRGIIDEYIVDEGYEFQDYILIIKKSSIHTCHRDNNGDFFSKNQKHPSYTIIIYLEDMGKCLGVIPESHSSKYFHGMNIFNNTRELACTRGDVILFNSNLVHVGSIGERDDNLRVQMKISHRDDKETLSFYEDYNKILKEENTVPKSIRQFQKNFTCTFPVFSDMYTDTNTTNVRTTHTSPWVKLYSYLFYGKADYYDVPDVK